MKILLTGADGQLGQALRQQLRQSPWQLVSLNRQQLDITNTAAVNLALQQHQPQWVINTAAYTQVDRAEQQPELAMAINALGAGYLARAARDVGAAILQLSTDYVFDGHLEGYGQGNHGYRESDTPSPINTYGRSKLAGEEAVAVANPQHLILRTAWTFGLEGNNFATRLLQLARQEHSLPMVAEQWGSPTPYHQLAKAVCHLLAHTKPNWGIYHYAGTPVASRIDFARQILLYGYNQGLIAQCPELIPVDASYFPQAAQRPRYSALNSDKIAQTFAIMPADWQAALAH